MHSSIWRILAAHLAAVRELASLFLLSLLHFFFSNTKLVCYFFILFLINGDTQVDTQVRFFCLPPPPAPRPGRLISDVISSPRRVLLYKKSYSFKL
jgi:hypothetical protein